MYDVALLVPVLDWSVEGALDPVTAGAEFAGRYREIAASGHGLKLSAETEKEVSYRVTSTIWPCFSGSL